MAKGLSKAFDRYPLAKLPRHVVTGLTTGDFGRQAEKVRLDRWPTAYAMSAAPVM